MEWIMNTPVQIIMWNGIALVMLSIQMLRRVARREMSDKYGIFWLVSFVGLFFLNFKTGWAFHVAPTTSGLVSVGFISASLIGIVLSAQLTAYSIARRQSVQELALVRFQLEELNRTESNDVWKRSKLVRSEESKSQSF